MSKLESILRISNALDIELSKIEKEQDEIRDFIKIKKNEQWHRMFDDIEGLAEYIKLVGYLDTGVLHREKQTYGFTLRENIISFYTIFHSETRKPETHTYAFSVVRSKPFAMVNGGFNWMGFLELLLDNWGVVFSNIENNLIRDIKRITEEKVAKVIKTQEELEQKRDSYIKG